MEKIKKCCFTGHRPQRLPWGYRECGSAFRKCYDDLESAIIKAIYDGYTYFISGVALGIDMLASEIVLKLKNEFGIKLECAIPCIGQSEVWSEKSRARYKNIVDNADVVTYVSHTPYFDGCMEERNKYMVENSSRIIAVYSGRFGGGGTKKTIEYAQNKGLDVVIITPFCEHN